MKLPDFISDFLTYAQTIEYREGLYVELSGLMIEVIFLIIGVKLVVNYISRHSQRTTDFASSFFIVQFLRDVAKLQLKSGGVIDINECLDVALNERKLKSLFSHNLYGNTENIINLLRIRMRSGEHISGHIALTSTEQANISEEARSLLVRLDNLLLILASMRQDEHCNSAFRFRIALTAISDYLYDLSKSNLPPPPRTFAPMSTTIAIVLSQWFGTCKRILDQQYQMKIRRSYAHLFFTTPGVIAHRYILRLWKRIRAKPYTDPYASNFPQLFVTLLQKTLGDRWSETIKSAEIDSDKLQMLITQHKFLSGEIIIDLLKQIRPFIDSTLWNATLAKALIADMDQQPITIVTVDAAKAQAQYFLVMLACEDEGSSKIIQETFEILWEYRNFSI